MAGIIQNRISAPAPASEASERTLSERLRRPERPSGLETRKRSLVKALTWRIVATIITMGVALALTGELRLAAAVGIIDTTIKFFSYYFHERMWEHIHFGRAHPPEYDI